MYHFILNFTLIRPRDNTYKRLNEFLESRGYKRTTINTSYRIGDYDFDESCAQLFPENPDGCSEADIFERHIRIERQAFEQFMAGESVLYKLEIYPVTN